MTIEDALLIIPETKINTTAAIYLWLNEQGFKLEDINDYIMRIEN